MSEQKNSINNNPAEEKKESGIPVIIGMVITVALVGALVVLYMKYQKVNSDFKNQNAAQKQEAQTDTAESAIVTEGEVVMPSEETIPSTTAPANVSEDETENNSGISSTVNINYEVKKLDSFADSINPNDFSENNLSDANLSI